MKAVYLEKRAGPDSLVCGEIPRPKPKDREVLVRVHATAIIPDKISTIRWELVVVAALLLGVATPAYPQASAPHQISSNELAMQVANPVTSLWSIQFQFNNFKLESANLDPASGKWAENLLFQPVMPVSLTKDVNLITRPVIPLYVSVPHPGAMGQLERTTTFGDMILAEVLSPANSGHWLLGAGPSFIFPTAHSDFTGDGKWQLGPAAVVGYLTDKFLVGAFAQQWWSYAGESDRRATSHINIQPFARLFLGEGWSVGYSGNVLADWKARDDDVWTVPIGVGISKIVKFGRLPVNLQIAGQYIPVRPQGGPEWNVQVQVTPVIPKLIKKTVFQ